MAKSIGFRSLKKKHPAIGVPPLGNLHLTHRGNAVALGMRAIQLEKTHKTIQRTGLKKIAA